MNCDWHILTYIFFNMTLTDIGGSGGVGGSIGECGFGRYLVSDADLGLAKTYLIDTSVFFFFYIKRKNKT